MPSNLKKINFDYEAMKTKELFFNDKYEYPTTGVKTDGVKTVFGRDLLFGEIPADRPYVYNSLVTSIDGKIAFEDNQAGPLIARNNKYGGSGSSLDYWILNMLRGAADAILVGSKSISVEKSSGGTGHCYDGNIESFREENGKDPIPWRVVVTMDGKDVVFTAAQFTNPEMSTFFYTTAAGVDYLKENSLKEVEVIGPFKSVEDVKINQFEYDSKKAYIIVTSESDQIDNKIGMKILREMGVETLLVESPTVTHIFMEEELLDELFINQSGLYVGGNAITIGKHNKAFSSEKHPHTELLSIHMHSPHFIYMRYRIIYR